MHLLPLLACLLVPPHPARPPRFADYPAADRYNGRAAAPKLTPGTDAWHFRTRIREAARGRPNFAGHYILAQWGCGSECLITALIDAKTGAVSLPSFTVCCWFSTASTEGTPDVEPTAFCADSRLVVFNGLLNEAGTKGPHYFRLERGQLVAFP